MSNRTCRILATALLSILLGIATAVLATLLVAATAFSEEPTIVTPLVVEEPMPVPVLVNPYARVPIFSFESTEDLTRASGVGFPIEGEFQLLDNGGAQIAIVGPWTPACQVIIHEFVHYLEAKMPDQAQRIRDAFHDVCPPKGGWDHADLEGAIVHDAP